MACLHTEQASELRLRSRTSRVVERVYKCCKCRRIVRRAKSRWASRRWHQYRPESGSMQARMCTQRAERLQREEQTKPYAQRVHEALAEVRQQARYTFKDREAPLYHPLAIRYRRLLRKWWTLPNADVTPYLDTGDGGSPTPKGLGHVNTFHSAVEKLRQGLSYNVQIEPDDAYKLARRAFHTFVKHEPLFWTRPDGVEAGERA